MTGTRISISRETPLIDVNEKRTSSAEVVLPRTQDVLRAEVVNDSVALYEEQSCVSNLQLLDSEACHACGRDVAMSCPVMSLAALMQSSRESTNGRSCPSRVGPTSSGLNQSLASPSILRLFIGTDISSSSTSYRNFRCNTGISVQYPDPDIPY